MLFMFGLQVSLPSILFLPGKGAAGAQLVEELKTTALTQSKRAMEGLEEMAVLMEYLDIYGVLDKVRLCYCMGRGQRVWGCGGILVGHRTFSLVELRRHEAGRHPCKDILVGEWCFSWRGDLLLNKFFRLSVGL
jgi:hypothetical protein